MNHFIQFKSNLDVPYGLSYFYWSYCLKEIILPLSDKEYNDYVLTGQSIYSKRMKKGVTDEEYARWVFLLGEHYKGQCLSES
jgi:hypothetical protein